MARAAETIARRSERRATAACRRRSGRTRRHHRRTAFGAPTPPRAARAYSLGRDTCCEQEWDDDSRGSFLVGRSEHVLAQRDARVDVHQGRAEWLALRQLLAHLGIPRHVSRSARPAAGWQHDLPGGRHVRGRDGGLRGRRALLSDARAHSRPHASGGAPQMRLR